MKKIVLCFLVMVVFSTAIQADAWLKVIVPYGQSASEAWYVTDSNQEELFDSDIYDRAFSWVALDGGNIRYTRYAAGGDNVWTGYLWSGTQETRPEFPVVFSASPEVGRFWNVRIYGHESNEIFWQDNFYSLENKGLQLVAYPATLNQWRTQGYKFIATYSIVPEPSSLLVFATGLLFLRKKAL